MGDEDIIQLRGVRKAFGANEVLRGVDLTVPAGATTVVIGPSGCGKSVLLKHIVGLLRPDDGEVIFDGEPVAAMSETELIAVRRRIGFVFQGGALFDSMDVEHNVCFPLSQHERLDRRQLARRCRDCLRLVGLDGTQRTMSADLSGGQKKRVALARAIIDEPDVILYDEPTTGLDPVRADLINELILKLQRELRTTAVVVTHDLASARKVGDRIAMLYDGRIIAEASPDGLDRIADPTVRHFVEGRARPDELRSLELGHAVNRKRGGNRSPKAEDENQ